MRERPILFSAPMVRALLDGTKTQTRRVVKGLADKMWIEATAAGGFAVCYDSEPTCGNGVWEVTEHSHPIACPYGQPGDRLWVREAFRFLDSFDSDSPSRVGERCIDAGYSKPWAPLQFEANGAQRDWMTVGTPTYPPQPPTAGKLRPGIHMPRWASRIDLEVTGVRVERLQDISEADAIAEGIDMESDHASLCLNIAATASYPNDLPRGSAAVAVYKALWEQINGASSWEANPWVWCVEFRRIRP